ncbi:MAG: SusC/RagA family TonB-linked outer membrane protein, partial [Pedobacter sp.]
MNMYKKLTLIMKFTTLILIASMMQVSAAGFAQKLTLKQKGITLGKLVVEIRKQTGYDVFFENTDLKSSARINADFNNTPLEQVIAKIVAPTGLSYTISDKTVIIKAKEKGFFESVINLFAAAEVTGKVLDSLGNPLPGASIKVKGGNASAYSNGKGEFKLPNVQSGAVLVISYIGYLTREVTITDGNADNLQVRLMTDVSSLAEVAVVSNGYQSLPRERSAGSFTQVNMDVVANRSISMNVLQSLDGLVPGLVVNNAPNK